MTRVTTSNHGIDLSRLSELASGLNAAQSELDAASAALQNEHDNATGMPSRGLLMRFMGMFSKRTRTTAEIALDGATSSHMKISLMAKKATERWLMVETLELMSRNAEDLAKYQACEAIIHGSETRRRQAIQMLNLIKDSRKASASALDYCRECVYHPIKYQWHVSFAQNSPKNTEHRFLTDGLNALKRCQMSLELLDLNLLSVSTANDLSTRDDPLTQALFFGISIDKLADSKMLGLNKFGGFSDMSSHLSYYQSVSDKLYKLNTQLKTVVRLYDVKMEPVQAERTELFARYFEQARSKLPAELVDFATMPAKHMH